MQKTVKYAAIALLVALLATTTAYAVLKYTATISNTAMIKGYGITLWRTDANVTVTSIPWGDLETGTSKDTETVFSLTKQLVVKNVGDYACYVGWKLNASTPLPSGVTLTAKFGAGLIGVWTENTKFIGIDSAQIIPVGGFSGAVQWILTIGADTPRGSINFNILLLAVTTVDG